MRHGILPVVVLALGVAAMPLAACSAASNVTATSNAPVEANANGNVSRPDESKVSTADFIGSVKEGLQARWADTTGVDAGSMSDAEYYDTLARLVDEEYGSVSRYEDKAFEDEGLGREAQRYIQALRDQKAAIGSARSGGADASAWDGPAGRRADCIRDFRDSYGLTVDEEYQSNLDQLFEQAEAYGDHVDEFTITGVTKGASSYGYVTFDVAVRNNTGYAKDFQSIQISLLDPAGNIILAEDRTYPAEVEPGQEYHMQVTEQDTGNIAGLSSTGYAWLDGDSYIEGKFSAKYKVTF